MKSSKELTKLELKLDSIKESFINKEIDYYEYNILKYCIDNKINLFEKKD